MSTTPALMDADEPTWVGDVLRFWFEQLSSSQWWERDDVVDGEIRQRFLALHERLLGQENLRAETPRCALATVVVLDQFSRNMFRGSPRAYAADAIARPIARAAIAAGFDRAMTKAERLFLYLPFEHSENAADQRLALDLIGGLGDASWTRYVLEHKEVIDRFGRFPHRNAVLGRHSSTEEIDFLKAPGSWF